MTEKKERVALESFMQYVNSRDALGTWEKKVIGYAPGYETTKSIGDAYVAIHDILDAHSENELAAWLEEMWSTINQYPVQASILYKALMQGKGNAQ